MMLQLLHSDQETSKRKHYGKNQQCSWRLDKSSWSLDKRPSHATSPLTDNKSVAKLGLPLRSGRPQTSFLSAPFKPVEGVKKKSMYGLGSYQNSCPKGRKVLLSPGEGSLETLPIPSIGAAFRNTGHSSYKKPSARIVSHTSRCNTFCNRGEMLQENMLKILLATQETTIPTWV